MAEPILIYKAEKERASALSDSYPALIDKILLNYIAKRGLYK